MFKDVLAVHKMTCYKLAKASGLSYTTINEIYRGQRKLEECSIEVGKKIAAALGITLDVLCKECEAREKLPPEIYPCFWDADPVQLDLIKNKTYIITRLLDKGGYAGLNFIKAAYAYEEIKDVAMHSRNFSPKAASFLKNVYHLKKSQMAYYSRGVEDWRL